jgi:hypothetical protein
MPPTGEAKPAGNKGKGGLWRRYGLIDRLPTGSRKELTWDGTAWHVRMEVPGFGVFEGEATSELRALYAAHAKYETARTVKESGS